MINESTFNLIGIVVHCTIIVLMVYFIISYKRDNNANEKPLIYELIKSCVILLIITVVLHILIWHVFERYQLLNFNL